ncbi:hypothetical protein RH915_08280 [Serpentinicella sp. ANB-PHB4]|uniref:tetratricopeptide repeat protein n=1 Tax=Serpentinicella sp. ANB-PHB4 TaxID=3074076 RepID=UPI002860DFCB|nr:hypothetical protein [Serpentinicella sp. ANB-PHB4]MDR5659487.1 hypothetical protein [Serpentinicella sp. ANB-PHB4]
MKCRQCNQVLKEDDKFCKKCGTKVKSEFNNIEETDREDNKKENIKNNEDIKNKVVKETKVLKTNNKKKVAIVTGITAVILVIIMFFSIRYYQNEKYYAGLLEEANAFMTKAQYEEAIDIYKTYLQDRSDESVSDKLKEAEINSLVRLGDQRVEEGKYAEALVKYEEALEKAYDETVENKKQSLQTLQLIENTFEYELTHIQLGNYNKPYLLKEEIEFIVNNHPVDEHLKNIIQDGYINQFLDLVQEYIDANQYIPALHILDIVLHIDVNNNKAKDLLNTLNTMPYYSEERLEAALYRNPYRDRDVIKYDDLMHNTSIDLRMTPQEILDLYGDPNSIESLDEEDAKIFDYDFATLHIHTFYDVNMNATQQLSSVNILDSKLKGPREVMLGDSLYSVIDKFPMASFSNYYGDHVISWGRETGNAKMGNLYLDNNNKVEELIYVEEHGYDVVRFKIEDGIVSGIHYFTIVH